MSDNPLLRLQALGQSIWLDFIRRGVIRSGELAGFIAHDGLRGVTSNPAIFEKAIAGSHDYDSAIRALALENRSVPEIYETLAVEDVQSAADLFRTVYDQTQGRDGYVSLEVSPKLAHDTAGTVAEGRRLWAALARPNVLIKVPATREGLPAIQTLIGEGINVNVTLLFSVDRYRAVAEAYLAGLEAALSANRPIDRIASVASFFLSRIDSLVDPLLDRIRQAGGPKAELATSVRGQVAIASARAAYQVYKEIYSSPRWQKLADKGAQTQRLLWASTSTKDPSYSDVKYVEALIGPDTVNTVPLETLNAYRDHGQPEARLEEGVSRAGPILQRLAELSIDLAQVTQQLEDEGVHKFIVPFDHLLATLAAKRDAAVKEPVDRQALSLGNYQQAVRERLAALQQDEFAGRLWRKDGRLWQSDPAAQQQIRGALGWLHVAEAMEENLPRLERFRAEVLQAGFQHVLHMGMGGSSLAPLVFARTFGGSSGAGAGLPLTVLDTTDPATILRIEKELPLERTLFIVATKSGTTAEPLAFGDYFYARLKTLKGDRAGENFVAITDPGTPLVKTCKERRFREIFLNFKDIGGRYSALSYFGLLPATLLGVNVGELLIRALRMLHANASCVPVEQAPGEVLGAVLGELARNHGRDKVTFLVSTPLATLGTWLEQLLAESTGKQGKGLLPVATEPVGDPAVYGPDRVFAFLRLKDDADPALESGVTALKNAGHPVVTIQLDDLLDLGQEFFRWEIATATAGAILGINAFDQPNVQESKDNTNRLLALVRKQGKLPEEKPALVEAPLSVYAPQAAQTVAETLRQFLGQARPGDYLALQAYLSEEPATDAALQAIRRKLRDRLKLATTLGYGPRFLHSTGQYHKGGPNTGLFLQLTADDLADAPVPGEPFTFGVLKRAQALGDLEALHQHGRRALRLHLGRDVAQGLAALANALD